MFRRPGPLGRGRAFAVYFWQPIHEEKIVIDALSRPLGQSYVPPLPIYSWGEGWGEGHFLSLEEPLTLTLSPEYRGEGIR
jgi:hypothetical protein